MSNFTPVTTAEIKYQTPAEVRTRSADFTADLETGETLSSGATVTYVAYISGVVVTDATLTISNVQIFGNKVKCTVTGGTVGTTYVLTFSVVTSQSQTKVALGRLMVVSQ